MILYHGTSSVHLTNIFKHGLCSGTFLTQHKDLAWDYALEATAIAVEHDPKLPDSENEPVVLAVTVSPLCLRPSRSHGEWATAQESLDEEGAAISTRPISPQCITLLQEG